MTTADNIQEYLTKEGFKVKHNRARKNKIEIRKRGFDDNIIIRNDENKELFIMVIDYLKEITHNLTFRNIKRTLTLFKDIFMWMWYPPNIERKA